MEILTKRNYFRFLSFMLIITTYLPVLTKNLPPVVRSHHIWTPIWIVSLIVLAPGIFKNRFFVYVVAYQAIFAILVFGNFWTGIDEWTLKAISYEIYYFTIAISLITYYKNSGDYIGLALLVKWAIIFIGITTVMSIYSSFIDPLYARKMIGGETDNMEEIMKYGGGTYGFASALICLFPIMVYYYRNNSGSIFTKIEIIIFGIVSFIAVLRIQIFANILLAVFVIFFSLSGRRRIRRSLTISMFLLLVLFSIPKKTYADFMAKVSNYFDLGSENRNKAIDLSNYLNTNDPNTDVGLRLARYPMLWKAFNESPLLGHSYLKTDIEINPGGHLFFMYRLTAFGIINFVLFMIIFILHIKGNMRIFNEEFTFYFLLSVLAIIILGLIKNLAGRELWYVFFFILPGFYYLPILKSRNK